MTFSFQEVKAAMTLPFPDRTFFFSRASISLSSLFSVSGMYSSAARMGLVLLARSKLRLCWSLALGSEYCSRAFFLDSSDFFRTSSTLKSFFSVPSRYRLCGPAPVGCLAL